MLSTNRAEADLASPNNYSRGHARILVSVFVTIAIFIGMHWAVTSVYLERAIGAVQGYLGGFAPVLLILALGLGLLALREWRRRRQEQARRVSAETRLRCAVEAMQAANESRSAFLARVSHELRTPLNAIIGFTELIHTEVFGKITPHKYSSYVQDVSHSATILLNLIEDILDISALDSGEYQIKCETLSLHSLVRSAKQDMAADAEAKDVQINVDVPENIKIWGDRSAMRRVVDNLVSNAVKFNRVGGLVDVKARVDEDGAVVVSILDTGLGIGRRQAGQSFEPFAEDCPLKARSSAGTGLGLTIVKHFVELHGGSVRLSSSVGVGTAVTIWLPAARTAPSAVPGPSRTDWRHPFGPRTNAALPMRNAANV